MKKKHFWQIFWSFFIILLTGVLIYFLFRHFKNKPPKGAKKNPSVTEKNKKVNNSSIENKDSDQNLDYQPIQPTQKEPEYQGKLLPISSAGIEYKKTMKENYPSFSLEGKKFGGTCFDCGVEGQVEKIDYVYCGKCKKKEEGDHN